MTQTFVAYGVPRSGTTALANLLNAHPQVFCGIERFPIEVVSAGLLCREGVMDKSIPTAHFERNAEILNSKQQLLAFGNKAPRYFYAPEKLAQALPDSKHIVVVREMADVFSSWTKRAENPKDNSWHRGQVGAFALLDHLLLIDALRKLSTDSSCYLCSYKALFVNQEGQSLADAIFAFLGVPHSDATRVHLKETEKLRSQLARKIRTVDDTDRTLMSLVDADALHDLIAGHGGGVELAGVSDRLRELQERAQARLPQLLQLLISLVLADNPNAVGYLLMILQRMFSLDRRNPLFLLPSRPEGPIPLFLGFAGAAVKGNTAEAVEAATALLRCFPGNPYLVHELAKLYAKQGEAELALQSAANALEQLPSNNVFARHLRALTHRFPDAASGSGSEALKQAFARQAAPQIIGYVDPIAGDELTGWALSPGRQQAVQVQLLIDGEVRAVQSAEAERPAIKKRGLHPTGHCGFSFELGAGRRPTGRETIAVVAESTTLKRAPRKFGPLARPEQLRLFFMHIPKTAGSSLNHFLMRHFPSHRAITHVESQAYRDDSQFTKKYDFISGHVGPTEARRWMNLDDFYWITLMRDPLQQLSSHLSWARFIGQDTNSHFFKRHPEAVRTLATRLQKCDYADPDQLSEMLFGDDQRVKALFDNFQTRALVDVKAGERVTEEHLAEALRRLRLFAVLGTTENYHGFLERLCSLAHWKSPHAGLGGRLSNFLDRVSTRLFGSPFPNSRNKHLNSQPERFGLDIQDPATQAVMQPLIKFDTILYDQVLRCAEP